MKKLLILIIPLTIGILLFLGYRFISSTSLQITALQVTATPQAEVFLDNISLGKTPLYNDKLKAGLHTVKLVPIGGDGLFNYEERVTLHSGVLTVVDRVFKTTEAESEVSIISLEAVDGKKATEVAITSSPAGGEVKLDEQPQGVTPLLLKDISLSDHQLIITKEGYNSKTLRIRPTEGYRVTVSTKLSIGQPVGESITPSTTPPIASESATKKATRIKISETPTGFLRVRSGPSITSTEVEKVNPNDTFPLLSEQDEWYKISLPSGKTGWVSKQYASSL